MVDAAGIVERPWRQRLTVDPRAIAGGAIIAALFLTALAAPLPAAFHSGKPAFVERCGSQRTVTGIEHSCMNEQQDDKHDQRDREPWHRRTTDDEREGDSEQEQAEASGREPAVLTFEAGAFVATLGHPRSIRRVYGRTLPSAFHKYSVR